MIFECTERERARQKSPKIKCITLLLNVKWNGNKKEKNRNEFWPLPERELTNIENKKHVHARLFWRRRRDDTISRLPVLTLECDQRHRRRSFFSRKVKQIRRKNIFHKFSNRLSSVFHMNTNRPIHPHRHRQLLICIFNLNATKPTKKPLLSGFKLKEKCQSVCCCLGKSCRQISPGEANVQIIIYRHHV